jgi:outer membrane receptor protein involved in Fe transport
LIGRASFSVDAPQHWTATAYVENINNEKDAINVGLTPTWDARVRPRTFGLQFEYRYGRQ